jgi:nucleotide-binding universal stress UspA family protein
MFKTIVFPYDFSRFSEMIVPYVKEFKSIGTEKVILVTVLEYENLSARLVSRKVELDEYKENTIKRIEPVKKELEMAGFTVTVFVDYGIASKVVVKKAVDESAELIVMGALGSGLASNLLGSTAQNVLRISPLPVLIVPAK